MVNKLKGSEEMKTVTFKVHESELAAFDDAVSESSRSKAIREIMRERIDAEPQTTGELPKDRELRKAYLVLDEVSPPNRRIKTATAESRLADRLNVPKETVRERYVRPLEERGLVVPRWGSIGVVEL